MTQTAIPSPIPPANLYVGLRETDDAGSSPGLGNVTFKYDPFGRRIEKGSWLGTTTYLYDAQIFWKTTDQNGNEAGALCRHAQCDEPLSELVSGTTLYEQYGLGVSRSLTSTQVSACMTGWDCIGRMGT